MLLKVCAVKDSAADAFGRPFLFLLLVWLCVPLLMKSMIVNLRFMLTLMTTLCMKSVSSTITLALSCLLSFRALSFAGRKRSPLLSDLLVKTFTVG